MKEGLRLDYEIGPEIGRGRFGTVYRCSSLASGEEFAVKSVDKALLSDPLDRDLALREAKVHQLAAAGNPHAVQIHATYEDADSLHLVLDLCPGPDLFVRVSDRAPLPERDAAAVMLPLMEAIATCHRRGIAHRDVKLENVLFDGRGELKLADFGSAECFDDERRWAMTGLVGTPFYVAPEVVAGREYGEKVDVWSCGVILYMMLGGMAPFYGESAVEILEAVLRGNLRFPPRIFRGVSPAAKDLIRKMLCKDVSRRLSADQVLSN
ncbi:phosphoenolpyruvate carboxylase kinase 1 [Cocos nucifera]|uniref:Phosphoenolpyruvate carboxylase kinase 1 n=1 Tax=Cocos nucifera TaxID=13894 RepID=A0A8K0IJG7_COCNU|nr:phosphoenolpyruvate carboxylase kinase 1 [Cocos nucifera]